MKDLFSKALLGLAVLAPAAALADANNFNYLEGRYLNGEIEELNDLDVDGWELNGSVELTDQIFITAQFGEVEPDEGNFNVELETASLGLGYVFGQTANASYYGTLRYVEQEVAVNNFASTDEDGYAIGFGTRMNLSQQAELRLNLDYVDVGDEDTFVPSAQVVYSFTPQVAGVLDYSHSTDLDYHTVGLGLRFYFR